MELTAGTGLQGTATPAAVLDLAEAATRADDVAPLGEQNLLAVRHGTQDYRHRWLAHGQELVGYAVLDPAGSAELCVHPDHRRRGAGRRLLDALMADQPDVAVWAHGDLPGAQALAAATGLRVVRELWQMGRELPAADDATETQLSTGSELSAEGEGGAGAAGDGVRTFVVGQDEEAWVELNAKAFADHPEQGRLTVQDMRERQAEDWFDPEMLWLAHEADRPEALLASMWVKREGDNAEIYALGVAPEAQGRGLGGRLTQIALVGMIARGVRRTNLYVEGANAAAIRTYRRSGYERTAVDVQYSP